VRGFAVFLVVVLASVTTAATAHASDPWQDATLRWDEDRPRFRPVEYAVTGVTGVVALSEYFFVRPQSQPHWSGGILFDDAVRDALRARSPSALRTVWALSDVVGVSGVVLTVGIDSMLVPVLRGHVDVAWQLTWFDLEAYSLGSIVTFTLYDTVGRARPSYADCQRDPRFDDSCNVSPTASFPSGHVAEAFISAGLSCANHAYVPLYGSRLADILACARDLTLASADGVLRIVGDRHYVTDVLAGGAIGFAFGYGLPVLLHYASGSHARVARLTLVPVAGDRIGVAAMAAF
jgi:membrane-associated phospholipid phosphatase